MNNQIDFINTFCEVIRRNQENICPVCKKPVEYPDTIHLCNGVEAHRSCISKLRVGKFRKVTN